MPLTPEEAAQEGRALVLGQVETALPIVCEWLDEQLRLCCGNNLQPDEPYEIQLMVEVNDDARLTALSCWNRSVFRDVLLNRVISIYSKYGWLITANNTVLLIKPDPSALRRLAAQAE